MPKTDDRTDQQDYPAEYKISIPEADRWSGDMHPDVDPGLAGNLAIVHDFAACALYELSNFHLDEAFASLESAIDRTATALLQDAPRPIYDEVLDVLRLLQQTRRSLKQLQTRDAVDYLETVPLDIGTLLEEELEILAGEEGAGEDGAEGGQEDPVARIVEARDALEERLEEDGEPCPVFWPSLDLLVRQLNRGSGYTTFDLGRALRDVAANIGPRYEDLAQELREAAYELSQEERVAGRGPGSEES